ncbi:DNA polymerase delta subunit 1 [Nematocida major]|uniref:DNA polymerase delta subunit 1 n=1 Tax=Nematocida major TaxID=1912982 RepID=UPI0020073810|nr:DNA polymerase delta subunit 1 [Nematocida major]KAH9385583.1 DNA polymerase delta subunit 1 [Nematocida major]
MKKFTTVFVPLHMHYTVDANGPIMHLLGRSDSGEYVECAITGHFHYFYVPHTGTPIQEIIRSHKEIVSAYVLERLSIYGFNKPAQFVKVLVRDPKAISAVSAAVKNTVSRSGPPVDTYETNVGYILRFMIDTNLSGMEYVEVSHDEAGCKFSSTHDRVTVRKDLLKTPPLKILSTDIECTAEEGKFPNPLVDPVVQIGNVLSVYPFQKVERVLFCLNEVNHIPDATVYAFKKEEDLLMAYSQWILSMDPDIITGYNIVNFDLPYLVNRANSLGLHKFKYFGRTPEGARVEESGACVPGRILFDVLSVVKKEFNLHSYSLNSVSAAFLGEQKEDVHFSQIKPMQECSSETRKRLGIYCLKDAHLPLRIMHRKNLLVNYCELARVTGVPLEYLLTRGQGVRVMSQILRHAGEKKYILPVVNSSEETYEGGYVMEPARGFYSQPVVVLDYASLYPSIIMGYNLCYSTLVSKDQIKDMRPEEYTVSPTGDCFVCRDVKVGILPEVLRKLLQERKDVRKELAACTDPEMKASLNARQLALKVSANSVYGFTGAAKTGLPCIPVSRSVTGFGRNILKTTQELIMGEYNRMVASESAASTEKDGVEDSKAADNIGSPENADNAGSNESNKEDNSINSNSIGVCSEAVDKNSSPCTGSSALTVAYGDTDSVMVTRDNWTLQEAFLTGDRISEFITQKLPDPLTLEFEKVYHPFVLINKKRYAGCAKFAPNDPGKIDTKGIETVRRDNCLLIRDLMKECMDRVFLRGDIEGTKKFLQERVADLLGNKIGISQLIISKSITKKEEDYSVSLAHVSLAERMRKREGSGPGLGDRVSYVIRAGSEPLHERSEDPVYALRNNVPIDTLYYLKNQLSKPLERLLSYVIKDIDQILSPSRYSVCTRAKEMPRGIGSFFKKKKVCTICRVGEFPVCKACDRAYPSTAAEMQRKLYGLQTQYFMVLCECIDMQKSRHRMITCCNRDCPTYYIRIEIQKAIEEAHSKYDQIMQHRK